MSFRSLRSAKSLDWPGGSSTVYADPRPWAQEDVHNYKAPGLWLSLEPEAFELRTRSETLRQKSATVGSRKARTAFGSGSLERRGTWKRATCMFARKEPPNAGCRVVKFSCFRAVLQTAGVRCANVLCQLSRPIARLACCSCAWPCPLQVSAQWQEPLRARPLVHQHDNAAASTSQQARATSQNEQEQ